MRTLAKLSISSALCAGLFAVATLPAHAALPQGVSAGDVTTDSAVLWARTTTPGNVKFTLRQVSGGAHHVKHATINVTDPSVPAKALFNSLAAGVRYVYEVKDAEGARRFGMFRTANASGSGGGLRFGVTGDWRGELSWGLACTIA